MNAFERADALVRELRLPLYHREAIRALAKQVVLDAAECCEGRAAGHVERRNDGAMAIYREAKNCADQIRFNLLCREGQSICLYCAGVGCEKCDAGFRRISDES